MKLARCLLISAVISVIIMLPAAQADDGNYYNFDWEDYWKRLLPSILTVTDSWSQAYALFTAGEAPLVLSYGTSPVYHVEYEGSDRYRAAEFTDGHVAQIDLHRLAEGIPHEEIPALQAAVHWYSSGLRSVFLQDANSLIIKPANLVDILNHLKKRFPWVDRITSYARSHTIARIADEDLKAFCEAGLDRIHIGLESGSDQVLKMVKKGSTKEQNC